MILDWGKSSVAECMLILWYQQHFLYLLMAVIWCQSSSVVMMICLSWNIEYTDLYQTRPLSYRCHLSCFNTSQWQISKTILHLYSHVHTQRHVHMHELVISLYFSTWYRWLCSNIDSNICSNHQSYTSIYSMHLYSMYLYSFHPHLLPYAYSIVITSLFLPH